jgi:tetratricopeptide (TPR) repeat protein
MKRRWIAGALLFGSLAFACGRSEPRAVEAPPSGLVGTSSTGRAAWLAQVTGTHAEVDRLLDQHDAASARGILERALARPVPAYVAAEDRRIVLQDLWFRLGEVELELGAAERAQRAAEQGLALGLAADVFAANLRIVEGRALEALGRDAEAVDRYRAALEINEALLEKELQDEAPR